MKSVARTQYERELEKQIEKRDKLIERQAKLIKEFQNQLDRILQVIPQKSPSCWAEAMSRGGRK